MVVDHGAAIATGPPDRLKEAIGSQVSVTLANPEQLAATAVVLSALTGCDAQVDVAERTVTVLTVPGVSVLLPSLVRELDGAGVLAEDVAVRAPSLDDVFLALTGAARESAAGSQESADLGRAA